MLTMRVKRGVKRIFGFLPMSFDEFLLCLDKLKNDKNRVHFLTYRKAKQYIEICSNEFLNEKEKKIILKKLKNL